MAMMDELVQQIAARANIPPDKAMQAARTAIDFLDDRLPPPVKGNLKQMLGEGGGFAAPTRDDAKAGEPELASDVSRRPDRVVEDVETDRREHPCQNPGQQMNQQEHADLRGASIGAEPERCRSSGPTLTD